jgi:hypothetical protein
MNINCLSLENNKLNLLPVEILNIKNIIYIDESSYDINNISFNNEILIFSNLTKEITNLPINIKEIWLKTGIKNVNIKLPFGYVITFY